MNLICGNGIHFTIDGFRAVYVIIATFMWAMTALFSPEYFKSYKNKTRYYVFFAITFLALVGVFLSADLFTTFIFFEIMSFTSYVWVAQDEKPASLRAAITYLAVAVIGGLVMLLGLFMLYDGGYDKYLTCSLIFVGFAAKAGVYPLHIWLPKAHPVAPAPASALLSGILTKSGVYGILILSFQMMLGEVAWGKAMLILGIITMVLGAVLALFSIDLKRTLACSSMSQIGFIMVGVGMGTMLAEEGALAMRGTFLHMVNHSLIKLVLFMAAGVVYFNIHKLDLNEIRGFGRNKTFLKVVFAIGALGIGGIPLFNGYVSKTLLHEGILEGASILGSYTSLVEWTFLISGGCTLAYMIKLFVAVFVEKNASEEIQNEYDEMKKLNPHTGRGYIGKASFTALLLSAVLLPVLGAFPYFTMDKIADLGASFLNVPEDAHTAVNYFNLENLKGGLISIVIGLLLYFFVIRLLLMKGGSAKERITFKGSSKYVDRWPSKLDLENAVYRPLLLGVLPAIGTFFSRMCDGFIDGIIILLRKTLYSDRDIPRESVEGNAVTHFFGDGLDSIHRKLAGSDREPLRSYEHRMSRWYMKYSENRNIISRSLSFGLALASVGLLFMLGYVLIYYIFLA